MRLIRAAAREPAATADGQDPRTASDPASPGRLRAVTSEEYPDWDAVYRDNIGLVYRLMFAKVGNRPDAEDLTTEVFLAALRPLRLPASVGEVRAYLLATARTVLARYWARTLGHPVTTLNENAGEARAERPLESAAPEQAERILAAPVVSRPVRPTPTWRRQRSYCGPPGPAAARHGRNSSPHCTGGSPRNSTRPSRGAG